ncbi:hypothetical protein VNO80_18920 [Phaseolus coccineus]|uniref:Uncharacterized protein n=1 Tax=Phaseolus coccineus TaxID=3886 RepID=A0AAN9MJY2_PHACN
MGGCVSGPKNHQEEEVPIETPSSPKNVDETHVVPEEKMQQEESLVEEEKVKEAEKDEEKEERPKDAEEELPSSNQIHF